MFEIKDFSIKIKDRYFIQNLSFTLNKNDKMAIIGEEGNGKSTLLKSILGLCDYAEISGKIDTKGNTIGYLEQTLKEEIQQKTVYEILFENENDYYEKMNLFYQYLMQLQLENNILRQTISTLSGGEKVKIRILKLLLEEYDILFLDEPTNDLDIATLEWLEKFIQMTSKPILYVSHDETLLSKTANKILHLEQIKKKQECRYTLLKTTYDTYVEQRLRKLEKQTQIAKSEQREFDKKQKKLREIMQKVEYQQNTITRADPHDGQVLKKKMHALKSQEKKLEQTNFTEVPDVEESIHFFFDVVKIPKNKVILKLDIKELNVNHKILSQNISLEVIGNSHLCIIGNNGVGKTTLMREIYQQLKDRTDIHIGYMPQEYDDILSNYEYVLDFIVENGSKEAITKARLLLGNMKFTQEEMTDKITDLSNGTKAKLFLAKMVIEACDVLILDEPTRNVSPLSNPVIRSVLKNFQGTIISVSHDRKYIKEVIEECYLFTKDGLTKIDSNF